MLTASGNINDPYEVIGVVHAVVTRPQKSAGCGQEASLPIQEAYEAVTDELAKAAERSGGNALIHIGYDYRISVASFGCNQTKPVFEVYGWGTSVKVKR